MPMVTLARRAARIPFAPVVAAMFGGAAAILVLAAPAHLLEGAIAATGLPSLVPMAAPPLGLIARIGTALATFAIVASVLWAVLIPVARRIEGTTRARTPWHDAGYDADAAAPDSATSRRRRPIFAADELGAPLMSDVVVAPQDAVVDVEPTPIIAPDPELEAPLTLAEFTPEPGVAVTDKRSIASLIERLEAGLARRAANDPGPDAPTSAPAPLALSRDWIVAEDDDAVASPPATNDDSALRQALGTLRRFAGR